MLDRLVGALAAAFIVMTSPASAGVIIGFENLAPYGRAVPVRAYVEDEFLFRTLNDNAGLFDRHAPDAGFAAFVGHDSDFFGVGTGNAVRLTYLDARNGPFSLASVIAGPLSFGGISVIDLTVTATDMDGNVFRMTFADLATATFLALNLGDLASVVFAGSGPFGLDGIRIAQAAEIATPAPGALLLFLTGLAGAAALRRRG